MKKILIRMMALALLAGLLGGCAYGGVAASGDKVVITRNDAFLFGALRHVYVCKVTDAGVSDCKEIEAP